MNQRSDEEGCDSGVGNNRGNGNMNGNGNGNMNGNECLSPPEENRTDNTGRFGQNGAPRSFGFFNGHLGARDRLNDEQQDDYFASSQTQTYLQEGANSSASAGHSVSTSAASTNDDTFQLG